MSFTSKQKQLLSFAAFHLALVGGFSSIISGGWSGLSSFTRIFPSSTAAHDSVSRKLYSSRSGFQIEIPSRRSQLAAAPTDPQQLVHLQTVELIRTSRPFKNGCFAGSTADELLRAVDSAASEFAVPAELLISIIIAESNCRPGRVSSRGALGLMQLAPATAKALGVVRPHHTGENVRGGARYISEMLTRFSGDLSLALAAYNAGPGSVARYKDIPPFGETQAYVKKVVRLYSAVRLHTTGKSPFAKAA